LSAFSGLGPNLFYNSPMEACVVICRTSKPKVRKGKILQINAVNEVTRERAQSFLTDEHIARIVAVYRAFHDEAGFAKVATIAEARSRNYSLAIPLYVETATSHGNSGNESASIQQTLRSWWTSREQVRTALAEVVPDLLLSESSARVVSAVHCELLSDRAGWKRVRFGDVVENVNETESDPSSAGLKRFIGLEHLEPGSLHVRAWGDVSNGTTFTRRCRPGQVLFGKRRAYQRKVAVAEFDAVVSGDIYVLRAWPDRLLPELLPFICLSERFFDHAVGTSAGSLSPRTNWSSLASFELDLPSLDRQKRISELLWGTEAALRRALEVKRMLQQLEASSYHAWHLDLESLSNNGTMVVHLEDLCSHVVDCLHATPEYVDEGYSVIRTADVVPGRIVFSDVKKVSKETFQERIFRLRPNAGDVFYSREGERFGIAAPVPADQEICLGQRMMHFRPGEQTEAGFLLTLMNSPLVLGQAQAAVIGTTSPHVNIRDIRRFRVPPSSAPGTKVDRDAGGENRRS
jgi:type I restriction enzyme S subunit